MFAKFVKFGAGVCSLPWRSIIIKAKKSSANNPKTGEAVVAVVQQGPFKPEMRHPAVTQQARRRHHPTLGCNKKIAT